MGEHLPCKQGVKSSNLSVSIVKIRDFHNENCSLKTEYRKKNQYSKKTSEVY